MLTPTMQHWSQAWRDADVDALQACYAPQAVVLHPKKPLVKGQEAIGQFFSGGIGKIEVVFFPTQLELGSDMGYEYGEVMDYHKGSQEAIAAGQYAVTWIKHQGQWRIACHTWNSLG